MLHELWFHPQAVARQADFSETALRFGFDNQASGFVLKL
jgi:hypothetical protein